MTDETFAEQMAEDSERLRRQVVHATRPRQPMSMDEAAALHRRMEGQPRSLDLTPADLHRVKEWYNAVCDVNPAYIEDADHQLAEKLGFRPNRPRPR